MHEGVPVIVLFGLLLIVYVCKLAQEPQHVRTYVVRSVRAYSAYVHARRIRISVHRNPVSCGLSERTAARGPTRGRACRIDLACAAAWITLMISTHSRSASSSDRQWCCGDVIAGQWRQLNRWALCYGQRLMWCNFARYTYNWYGFARKYKDRRQK